MTDRAEIERLLQKTGRTLEGLPEEYPIETVDKIACMTDWEYSNRILHQSDVIELLIGALRDALEDRTEEISDAKFEEFSKKAREMAMRRHT